MNRVVGAAAVAWIAAVSMAIGQSRYVGTLDQHPAIDYRGGVLSDAVTMLAREIKDGKTSLAFDRQQGFLRSVLERLNVPIESQLLLFSKTGIQNAHTTPETPRALYFNDRVIVGYIPGAPVLRGVLQETVDYLLFADEVKLTAPVRGGSAFWKTFGMTGPKDRTGRSLREHDLQSRLFKYRCSYMIYSPAFDALPAETRAAVFALMSARLGDRDTMAILDETKPGWR